MLAKLGDFLKPAPSSRDAGQKNSRNNSGRENPQTGAEGIAAEDVVLLSISAIRALVTEEASLSSLAPDLLRKLALLEQHGLQNLPVMPGQAVADAIVSAASYLSSLR